MTWDCWVCSSMTRASRSCGEVSQRRRMSRRASRWWGLLVSPGNLYARASIGIDTHSLLAPKSEHYRSRSHASSYISLSAEYRALSRPTAVGVPYIAAPPAMMKLVAVMALMVCLAHSQRPPYAGSSNKWPAVLPQYLEGRDPPPTSTPANADDGIVNRIDGTQDAAAISSAVPISSAASAAGASPSSALDLPVDARGDIELINRIKTWPRDKQPFWFINWQQIQAHRGDTRNRGEQATVAQVNTRSFFAG